MDRHADLKNIALPEPTGTARLPPCAGRWPRVDRRHGVVVERLPRLQPPPYSGGVAAQLETMPHVMFGGLVHQPALTLAARLSALPRRVCRAYFFGLGIGRR